MKIFAIACGAAAACASTTQAALTPYDTTFDYTASFIRAGLGKIGEAVYAESSSDPWLAKYFNYILTTTFSELDAGNLDTDAIEKRVEDFANAVKDRVPTVYQKIDPSRVRDVDLVIYAPQSIFDITFDALESIVGDVNDPKFSGYIAWQRQATEQLVRSGAGPALVMSKMNEISSWIGEQDNVADLFQNAISAISDDATKRYGELNIGN